ncbi:MAG TPA: hypothetical protein VH249_12580 [Xanthobacteraceae bacterium]|jgi:hypothetical protein|nr:hypothetical protein [Xanthobacteraceae bacterium]
MPIIDAPIATAPVSVPGHSSADAAISSSRPSAAPVSEPGRIQVGSQLTGYLLIIVAGAIFLLMIYLVALDVFTSAEVSQVYEQTFRQMTQTSVPSDVSGIGATAKIFDAARSKPDVPANEDDTKKIRAVVDQLKASKAVPVAQADRLDQCIQFATTKPSGKQKPADATKRTATLNECGKILEPLSRVSPSQALDIERLRLLKDYAKDAHEHRQAFRSFWLQAAQLILLNLLLPLLTALLGYIFGTQATR